MDPLGLLILLIVAAVVDALGEMIGGVKAPGGWIGSILTGLIGAWIGSAIFHFGPTIGAIQVLPAIVGAILFVLILRVLLDTRRRRAV